MYRRKRNRTNDTDSRPAALAQTSKFCHVEIALLARGAAIHPMARARPALLSAAAQCLLTLAIPRCQGCSFIVANFNLTTHDESTALAVANWYNRRRGPASRHSS